MPGGRRPARLTAATTALGALAWLWAAATAAQPAGFEAIDSGHPAVDYAGVPVDRVSALARELRGGTRSLAFEAGTGYLRSLLEALDVPAASQVVVYSRTSLQAPLIDPTNPRAIYFNDEVAVAWMNGGFIEIAAQDPQRGTVFYILHQEPTAAPVPRREGACLRCHQSLATLGVAGLLARSVPSARDGRILPWLGNYTTDHRSPLAERWGGWYVTGDTGGARHLGNTPIADPQARELPGERPVRLDALSGRFETGRYLTPYSDIVALLVFDHQMHMQNLLTRLGWEARILAHRGTGHEATVAAVRDTATAVVDYLLFVDEAPLPQIERSAAGFAEAFGARGPRDRQGRSLRDLDLDGRLFRYPCSFLIYSETFADLPAPAKEAVLTRLSLVLSGADPDPRYERLRPRDREAVVEILRDTLPDLPASFAAGAATPPPSRP